MKSIFLSLGSNLGNKKEIIDKALYAIDKRIGRVLKKSHFYETQPWGYISSNNFFNICIEIESNLSPFDILNISKMIEIDFHRTEKTTNVYKDRTLDIDILFYQNNIIRTAHLIIPHIEVNFRKFVLVPMNEIAYDFVHPITKKTISETLSICADKNRIKKIEIL